MEHEQVIKVCTYFRENDEDNLDLTRARVAVSATFAMVGGPKWPPL